MIRITKDIVYGLEESVKCIRYSFNPNYTIEVDVEMSDKQLKVAKNCFTAPGGSGHDSALKGVIVQFDLEAPHYWLPQIMRYHWVDFIMSTSKMHSLTKMDLDEVCTPEVLPHVKEVLNSMLSEYNECDDKDEKKKLWKIILANCPLGLMLRARISTNYMQLKTIYHQRKNHKLGEWHTFCEWIETLPRFKELVLGE